MKDLAQAADKPMVDTRSREDRIRAAAYRRYLARSESEGDASIDHAPQAAFGWCRGRGRGRLLLHCRNHRRSVAR